VYCAGGGGAGRKEPSAGGGGGIADEGFFAPQDLQKASPAPSAAPQLAQNIEFPPYGDDTTS
jgi:hypothetical protein